MLENPKRELLRVSDTGSSLSINHISISDKPYCIAGIPLYIHIQHNPFPLGKYQWKFFLSTYQRIVNCHVPCHGDHCLDGLICFPILVWGSIHTKPYILLILKQLLHKYKALNTLLSVWYPFIITPWLWYYLPNLSLNLTVSIYFISTWCLIII